MDNETLTQLYDQMPNAQKIALVMIAIGEEAACKLLSEFHKDELRKITYWIDQMQKVPSELIQKSVEEFHLRLNQNNPLHFFGGRNYLSKILDKAFGEKKSKNIVKELIEQETDVAYIMNRTDIKKLSVYLKDVSSQTIALVIFHLDLKRSSEILCYLPFEKQYEIFKSLVGLDDLNHEAYSALMQTSAKMLGKQNSNHKRSKQEGIHIAAKLFHTLPAQKQKQLLEELGNQDPSLVATLIPYLELDSQAKIREKIK